MKYQSQLGDLNTHLNTAKNVLIALPANLTQDKLAAGLALALVLEQAGKKIDVVTGDTIRVSHTNLFGVDQVKTQLPQNNNGDLIFTLEGVVDSQGMVPSLEKLDWYPEGQNLNLVFHVVPGQKFEPANISWKHQTDGYNLLFVLGAASLNDLGSVYPQNIQQFTGAPLINIDNNQSNSNYGYLNIVDPQAGTISEMVMEIMKDLNLNIDQDAATNILTGIYETTQNLTTNVKPDTFMAVGLALQAGGRIPGQPMSAVSATPAPSPAPAAAQPVTPQLQSQFIQPAPLVQPQGFDLSQYSQPAPQPLSQPQFVPQDNFTTPTVAQEPQPQVQLPPQAPSAEERPMGEFVGSSNPEIPANPAPDWLTPKVFKGGSIG